MSDSANVQPDEAAARLLEGDRVPAHVGITLDHVAAGAATVSMLPAEWMLNGAGIVHGGLVFTLADQAFAFACNSRGELHVSRSCEIEYLRPAVAGRRLIAAASERTRDDQGGLYDVVVADEDERVVARFTGHSRRFRPR